MLKRSAAFFVCLAAACLLTVPGILSAQGSDNGKGGSGKGLGKGGGRGQGALRGSGGQQNRSSPGNNSSGADQAAPGPQNSLWQADAYVRQKDYENAALEYDKALAATQPDDARNRAYIYERQGWLALMDGDISGAKESYLMAIDEAEQGEVSDKNLVNAYRGLAFCFEKTGDIFQAVETYKKALKLTTSQSAKRDIKKKLQRLEAKPKDAAGH